MSGNPLLTDGIYEATPDGQWVNSDFRRLAEVIQDYDPEMFLSWIPLSQRTEQDTHPYCVVHEPLGRPGYVVFYLSEAEMARPDIILSRIFTGDTRQHDVGKMLKTQADGAEVMRLKKLDEELDEKRDFVRTLFKSPKGRYKHGGKVYE